MGETELYNVPLAVQCIYGWSDEGSEDGDGKEGSEIPGGWERLQIELEEDLREKVEWFAEVCKRRGLKVNVDKNKVMVLNGEEVLV